jgi:nitrite reductase/ring-hydroxylating ferredoxin subunit
MTVSHASGGPTTPGVRREHLVGRLDELPMRKVHRIEIEGRTVGIIRTDAGVFAIGNHCPHQGGPMCFGHVTGTMLPSGPDQYVYGEDGLVIQCPWHAYEYRVDTGESVGQVVRGRVPVYKTEVRDGAVYCTLVRKQAQQRQT